LCGGPAGWLAGWLHCAARRAGRGMGSASDRSLRGWRRSSSTRRPWKETASQSALHLCSQIAAAHHRRPAVGTASPAALCADRDGMWPPDLLPLRSISVGVRTRVDGGAACGNRAALTGGLGGSGRYACEKCAKKVDAIKGTALQTVPYVLNLQLKRFDYDWELDRRVKLDDAVEFPLVLDIAPYMSDPPPAPSTEAGGDGERGVKEEGEEEEVAQVPRAEPEPEVNGDGSTSAAAAAGGVGGAPVPNTFGKDGQTVRAVDKSAASAGDGTLLYDLFAILIHRGTAGFGHYYAYIRDPDQAGWFEFNDSTITALHDSDIAKAYGGAGVASGSAYMVRSTASAYMLMYHFRIISMRTGILN
jgi:hypothetical protein